MLDNAEQNIGNSAIIQPQLGPPTTIPQTNPERIIQVGGPSARGQTTTIVMTVSRLLAGRQNPNPGFPGPITGIVEFGNGGRFTRIEFDLPVGPFSGSIDQATSAVEPQDGLVMVAVPTSTVRAYARYDNLLLAPVIGTNVSHAQLSGVPVVGPGGPVVVTNPAQPPPPPPPTIVIPPEPVQVKAMVAYFTKTRSKVYKTVNCYLSSEVAAPAAIRVGTPSVSIIAGFPGYAFYVLPAFTKSVKVLRFPDTSAMSVLLHNGVRPVDYINIAANVTAPTIEVIGSENIIGLTSGNDPITMLQLVCEVGV
jgi:hypothetical protein